MSVIDKLIKLNELLKPDINAAIQHCKTKYEHTRKEISETKMSEKYISDKLKSIEAEFNTELGKYTKNILTHIDLTKDSSVIVSNLNKYADVLNEFVDDILIKNLIETKKKAIIGSATDETKYLPQHYLDKVYNSPAQTIYETLKRNDDIGDSMDTDNENYIDSENEDDQDNQDDLIDTINNKHSDLKMIYIEKGKKIGAYGSSLFSNQSINISWIYIAVLIVILILLNQLYISCQKCNLSCNESISENPNYFKYINLKNK